MDGLRYRFGNGFLFGHTARNIVMAAIQKANNLSSTETLAAFSILADAHRKAKTISITDRNVDVRYFLPNDLVVDGEHKLDTIGSNLLYDKNRHFVEDVKIISSKQFAATEKTDHYQRMHFRSDAERKKYRKTTIAAAPLALNALRKADMIVIAMGDLFTSVLPPLCFRGIKKAFRESKARIVVMLNIMTKTGETDSFTALDFLNWIEKRIGRKADVVVANNYIPAGTEDLLQDYQIKENKVTLPADVFEHRHRFIVHGLAYLKNKTLQHDPALVAEVFGKRILPAFKNS